MTSAAFEHLDIERLSQWLDEQGELEGGRGVLGMSYGAAMALEVGVGLLCAYTFWRQGDPT